MPRTRQWTLAMPGQWLCATFLALVLLACGRQTASVPEVDHPAPPFTAQNLRGEAVSLGDWRGRPVLLDFWATWCKPCKEEFPAFQRLMEEIPELVVVAVAVGESAQQVQPYMEQTGFPFVTLPDPRSEVAKAYGVTALPTSCLIGPDGVLLRRQVGKMDAAEWKAAILALVGSAAAATPTATGAPGKTDTTLAVTTETANMPLPAATSTLSPVADRTGTAKAVTTKTNTRTTEVVTTKTSTATATLRPSPTRSPLPVATATPPPTPAPLPPTASPPTAVPPTATPFRSRTPSPTRPPSGLRLDTCCTDKEVLPGQTAVFEATLTNTGGGRDRFDIWLNKALPGNWQGMFCIGTVCYLQGTVVVELDAGASQAIEVKVRAADNAASGSQGHVTLGAASQSDASVRRTQSWSTTVVAPTPTLQPSPTASETAAPSPTATEIPAPSATPTELPLPTATATEPATATPEPTMTEMPVPSATATETSVPTARPSDGGRAKE